LAGTEKVIQDAWVKLDQFSHKDSYQRAYLSTHEQSGSTHSADRDDAKWQQTIARLEQRLANAQNRIRKLEQQAERWQNRANQLEKAYTQSLSWRITAPVRSLWRFFRSSVGS
jgi:predicted  nucleic acid-binding Zn-ribbon protein